jgi:hypothetical protein
VVRRGTALLALSLLAGGCARRASAYHFRAPLVGAVNSSAWLSQPDPAPGRLPDAEPGRRYRDVGVDHRRAGAPARPAARPSVRLAIASEPLRGAASGDQLAAALRQLVGRRDQDSSHVRLALSALQELGAGLDPSLLAARDGPALRELAGERGALLADGEAAVTARPRLGDLLLFDRVEEDRPASLIAIVVSTDSRDVVEFVYLARGVVRRGYLSRAHPADKRDADGRVLNTFIRHSDGGDPADTRYLAGELYGGLVRLDRLLR